jgi:FtsH-binding integral membrane protein
MAPATYRANAYAAPLSSASEDARTAFFRRVGVWTMLGLIIAFAFGGLSAIAVASVPILQGRWAMMGIIFGCMFVTNSVAQRMVSGDAKIPGFLLGTAAEGVALGYIMLGAVLVGADAFGPGAGAFTLLAQAAGLTLLSGLGMLSYVWTAPRDLSMVRGLLQVAGVPMLVLMVVSFVFPIGGFFGLLLSFVFIAISSAGLLYSLNQVMHVCRTDQHMEGAYAISIGILVLFWNILSLLMKLQSRD